MRCSVRVGWWRIIGSPGRRQPLGRWLVFDVLRDGIKAEGGAGPVLWGKLPVKLPCVAAEETV